MQQRKTKPNQTKPNQTKPNQTKQKEKSLDGFAFNQKDHILSQK
jgi:hypothetical protein